MGYVKNLQYEEDPDYDYLKGLFEECIRGMNETYDNIYDWSTISNFRTVLSNTGKENFTLRARATKSLSFGNNKTIENNIKVTRRIPRKMKKDLKKKYGDMWLLHHPNTETVYNLS